MLEALHFATVVSLILAIVLVVTRNQPLVRVVKPRYDSLGPELRSLVCLTLGVAMLGGWLNQHSEGALVYYWATLITDLRAGP